MFVQLISYPQHTEQSRQRGSAQTAVNDRLDSTLREAWGADQVTTS